MSAMSEFHGAMVALERECERHPADLAKLRGAAFNVLCAWETQQVESDPEAMAAIEEARGEAAS